MLQRAWFDVDTVPLEVLERYEAAMQIPEWTNAFVQMMRVSPPSLSRLAPSVFCHVLVVNGLDDRLVPPSESRDFSQLFPNAELVELDECGHCPQEEQVELFCDCLTKFIYALKTNSVESSGSSSLV